MLKVGSPTVQQNLKFITTNIALEGEGEAQSFFYMSSLIIFVRDCGKQLSILRFFHACVRTEKFISFNVCS